MSNIADLESLPPGPILAVDYGDYRFGFALTTSKLFPVMPLEDLTLSKSAQPGGNYSAAGAHVLSLFKEYAAKTLLVGVPLNYDGTIGPAAENALKFARYLDELAPGRVHLADERLTSYEAGGRKGVNPNSRAAAAIVEQYLADPACRLGTAAEPRITDPIAG